MKIKILIKAQSEAALKQTNKTLFVFLLLLFTNVCTPLRDSVLKDVERNYSTVGFLDVDTYQIFCPLLSEGDRVQKCKEALLNGLVAYKERYEHEANQRRTHTDFTPFITTEKISNADRERWRTSFSVFMKNHTRLVYEEYKNNSFSGVFRLRIKDLIYRVQEV